MIIRELYLKNFGKFQNQRIFLEKGINVIYGENESGKTTLHRFVQSMFFGLRRKRGTASRTDEYTKYTPWKNPGWYEGSLIFECDEKRFRLERDFKKNAKEAALVCETDGELLSVADGDLDMLLGNVSETAFENTVSVGQLKSRTQEGLYLELRDWLGNFQAEGELKLNPEKALLYLREKRKEWESEEQQEEEKKKQEEEKLRYKIDYQKEEIRQLQGKLEKLDRLLEENVFREEERREEGEKTSRNFSLRLVCYLVIFLLFGLRIWFLQISWIFLAGAVFTVILLELSLAKKAVSSKQRLRKKEEQESRESLSGRERRKEQKRIFQENLKERRIYLENLEEELQELQADCKELFKIRREIESLVLAEKRLKTAAKEAKGKTGTLLKDRISGIFCSMTQGKYRSVILDGDFQIFLDDGEKTVGLYQVSQGTAEQVYLALRLASGEILGREEELPVMLDETFSMYDDQRLFQTLSWLAENRSQTLIFTCHKREIEALKALGIPFKQICL